MGNVSSSNSLGIPRRQGVYHLWDTRKLHLLPWCRETPVWKPWLPLKGLKSRGECMQSWDIFFQGFPGINFCQMGLKHLTRMIFDPWGGDFKQCLCFALKLWRRFPIWFRQTATTKLQTSLQKSRHPFRGLHGKTAMNICEPWTSWDGIVMLVICDNVIFFRAGISWVFGPVYLGTAQVWRYFGHRSQCFCFCSKPSAGEGGLGMTLVGPWKKMKALLDACVLLRIGNLMFSQHEEMPRSQLRSRSWMLCCCHCAVNSHWLCVAPWRAVSLVGHQLAIHSLHQFSGKNQIGNKWHNLHSSAVPFETDPIRNKTSLRAHEHVQAQDMTRGTLSVPVRFWMGKNGCIWHHLTGCRYRPPSSHCVHFVKWTPHAKLVHIFKIASNESGSSSSLPFPLNLL